MKKALTTPDIALDHSAAATNLTRDKTTVAPINRPDSETADYKSVPFDLLVLAEKQNTP
jgi:hypothetical protein